MPQGTLSAPFGFTGELHSAGLVSLRARWYDPAQGRFLQRDSFTGGPMRPQSLNRYAYTENNPVNWTDPSGRCVGWLWRDPTCQLVGTDYTRWDYAGAGQVVVAGLGIAATVVACAGTGGLACATGAASAGAVTSWRQQALDNAGQPVGAAITHVSPQRIAAEAAVAGVSGSIGHGAFRLMGPVRRRIATGTVRATMQGSLVGGVSAGSEQALINLLDGNPTTGPLDGVLTATLFGGSVGGLVGRVGAVHQPALARPGLAITRTPTMYEATVDGFYVRGIRKSEGTLYLNFRTKIIVSAHKRWVKLIAAF